jgi:hypothetical protein
MSCYCPPSYLNPRPGEVRHKEWLLTMADRLGVSKSAVSMMQSRGSLKPKIRRANARVVFVIQP